MVSVVDDEVHPLFALTQTCLLTSNSSLHFGYTLSHCLSECTQCSNACAKVRPFSFCITPNSLFRLLEHGEVSALYVALLSPESQHTNETTYICRQNAYKNETEIVARSKSRACSSLAGKRGRDFFFFSLQDPDADASDCEMTSLSSFVGFTPFLRVERQRHESPIQSRFDTLSHLSIVLFPFS